MSYLAIFGWLVLLGIGLWLFLVGCYFAWIAEALGGEADRLLLIPIGAGAVLIALAIYVTPFTISIQVHT